MKMIFAVQAFVPPFTIITAAEAAKRVTVALCGPDVFRHQSASDPRFKEMQHAQESALSEMYHLLNNEELTAYIEDAKSGSFRRVPSEYFTIGDSVEFGRCFSLSSLYNTGIPDGFLDAPILFLKSEIEKWASEQADKAIKNKRGRPEQWDTTAFITEVVRVLDFHGSIHPSDFPKRELNAHMWAWCTSTWGSEPGTTWFSGNVSKGIAAFQKSRAAN